MNNLVTKKEDTLDVLQKREIKQNINVRKLTLTLQFTTLAFQIFAFMFIYQIIQKPSSILNKELTKEAVARERAKILWEIAKEKDLFVKELGLEILKTSYGLEGIDGIEELLIAQSNKIQQKRKTIIRNKIDSLNLEKDRQVYLLGTASKTQNELKSISITIKLIDIEINKLKRELNAMKD